MRATLLFGVASLLCLSGPLRAEHERWGWSDWECIAQGRFGSAYVGYTYRVPWQPCDRLEVRVVADCSRPFAVSVMDWRGRTLGRVSGFREVIVPFPLPATYSGSHFIVRVESLGALGGHRILVRRYPVLLPPPLICFERPVFYDRVIVVPAVPVIWDDPPSLSPFDGYDFSGVYRLQGSSLFPDAWVTLAQVGSQVRVVIRRGGRDGPILWSGDGRVEGKELRFEWEHEGRRGTAFFQRLSEGRLKGEFRQESPRRTDRADLYRR